MSKVYVIRGYGKAFMTRQCAEQTIRATWSDPRFFEITNDEGSNAFVIKHLPCHGWTTVHIDEVDVLVRATHL